MSLQNNFNSETEEIVEIEYLYKINKINRLTDTIYELQCEATADALQFSPGQYVKILCSDEKFRNFSIASGNLDSNFLTFHLRIRKHNQTFLDFLLFLKNHEQPLHIKGPYGLNATTFSEHHELLLIAEGMGIVPFVSILKSVLQRNIDKTIHLIWLLNEEADNYLQAFFEECNSKIQKFHYQIFKNDSVESVVNQCENTTRAFLFVSGGDALLNNVLDFIRQKKLIVHDVYSDIN